jgi:phosphatidylserine/phosphatidylglycerophosphate/cardiolipin synthase-like enzyme
MAEELDVAEPFVAHPDADPLHRHRFTYRGSEESIRAAVVELIRGAKRKVFLASFRIGDPEVFAALFDAVDRLRGGVYVVTALDEKTLRRGLVEIEDIDDVKVDVAAQHKQFDRLTRRGIALRGHEQCHAKFLVVDDEVAVVSSANLETSALADQPDRHRRATGESGVVITEPGAVDRLGRFFARLWYAGCTWEAPPGAEYALRERVSQPSPVTVAEETGPHGPVWTDGAEHGILRTLHDVIGLARHELLIATFSLNGIRSRPEMLLDPLRRAMAKHPLKVRLLVRSRNNVPGHRADAGALAALGVSVEPDSGTHAKGVIADGRHGALFSANLDAAHGLYDGVEMGVRLDGRPVLAEARRYLLHAMAHADSRFVSAPAQRELAAGLRAAWQRPWPKQARWPVLADDADWSALVEAAGSGPVLWEDNGHLRIYAGTEEFLVQPGRQGVDRLVAQAGVMPALDRMNGWYEHRPAVRKQPDRGICTAVVERVDG